MKFEEDFHNDHDTSPSFALQIIPPLYSSSEHAIALEATMQSLVLDRRHPIALELAGTPERRRFIVRATTQAALDHVELLLRSQYPQSEIHPLKDHEDPFRLEDDEAVSAVELVAGALSYLPLRTWKEAQAEGSDPLLGLLAALSRLPERTRVVAQLSLLPAASNWSYWSLRKAVESPLEPEIRAKEQQRMVSLFTDEFSTTLILNVGLLAGILFLFRSWIPGWMWPAIVKILTGKAAQVTSAQDTQLLIFAGIIVGLELLILLGYSLFSGVNKRRKMYDPQVVNQKVSRMAYHTRLRLYAIGPKTEGSAGSVLSNFSDEYKQRQVRKNLLLRMVAAYRQFHMANGAFFIPRNLSNLEARRLLNAHAARVGQGWQHGLRRSRHMISVDALASLWHMPDPKVLPELALVEHRRSRTMLIPPAVTKQSEGLKPIGYSQHAGYRLPFALTPEFFTFHTLIGGKAGEGKSMFLQHVAHEAMKLGGLVLVDPFGNLCEDVLRLVPPERQEDVVFIDLADPTSLIGLNPLDVTLGRGRDKFIADLLKMLAQLWASSWGARMENAFEMSLRTLFEANKALVEQDSITGPQEQYTLLDVLPLLTNVNFCHVLLQRIQDDYLHRWWREYYEPLSIKQQRDVITPIAAKVAKFESIVARRILGQSVSTINLSQMIEERKIILFKLAKGVVGSEVSSMIGATVLGLVQSTLEEQGRRNHQGSTRLSIILDEFQRIAGADYRVLSELHKYGATFFLSTQSLDYLQKLNPLLLPTIQANVRQMVAFNMSAQDAGTLAKDFGVDQEDILHQDINSCYVSVLANGRRQPTFSLQLNEPDFERPELAESIRTRCRIRYTQPVADIDERLRQAMLRSVSMVPEVLPKDKDKDKHRTNKPHEKRERPSKPTIFIDDELSSPELQEEYHEQHEEDWDEQEGFMRERYQEGFMRERYSEGYRERYREGYREGNARVIESGNTNLIERGNTERGNTKKKKKREKAAGIKIEQHYDPFAFREALSDELREELELIDNAYDIEQKEDADDD